MITDLSDNNLDHRIPSVHTEKCVVCGSIRNSWTSLPFADPSVIRWALMTHNLPIDGNGSIEGEIAIRLNWVIQSAGSRRHQYDSFQQQGEISQAKHCLPFFAFWIKFQVIEASANRIKIRHVWVQRSRLWTPSYSRWRNWWRESLKSPLVSFDSVGQNSIRNFLWQPARKAVVSARTSK